MTIKIKYWHEGNEAIAEREYRNIHPKSIEITGKYLFFSHSEPTYPAYTNAAPYKINREKIVSIEFIK